MQSATALIWRLLMVAETRFRKLNAYELLQDVHGGQKYKDGKPIEQTQPSTEVPLKEAA